MAPSNPGGGNVSDTGSKDLPSPKLDTSSNRVKDPTLSELKSLQQDEIRALTPAEIEDLRRDTEEAYARLQYLHEERERISRKNLAATVEHPPSPRDLTPSEIESLQQDKEETYQQMMALYAQWEREGRVKPVRK